MVTIDELFGDAKPHVVKPAFAHVRGPHDAKVVFVGEAWGAEEEKYGVPFVGNAGHLFNQLLMETGWAPFIHEILLTNVLAARPPNNKLEAWCAPKSEVGKDYALPPLRNPGKYLRPEYLGELERLKTELLAHPRNLIVALGGTASWALLGMGGIGRIRGYIASGPLCPELKILPTFHPSYLFQSHGDTPIVKADLMKALREKDFPEIRRPKRRVLVFPTLAEIREWISKWKHTKYLSVDIETKFGQITEIGFAPTHDEAICISITDLTKPNFCFWPTLEEEIACWELIQEILLWPCEKIFQNGLYDLQYLLRMQLKVINCAQDTMLLHHSLYPELLKGLGFLGSIYTNEASWKLMRGKSDELKRDE